jgi:hypothetical protein
MAVWEKGERQTKRWEVPGLPSRADGKHKTGASPISAEQIGSAQPRALRVQVQPVAINCLAADAVGAFSRRRDRGTIQSSDPKAAGCASGSEGRELLA